MTNIYFRRAKTTLSGGGGLLAMLGTSLALSLAATPAAASAPVSCADLMHIRLAKGSVVSATELTGSLPAQDIPPSRGAKGSYINPVFSDLPQFCRVFANVASVKGSKIGVELWMPAQWNGKLLAIGNHGFGGEFERADMAMGLHRGYAVVATDGGHSAPYSTVGGFSVGDARFALQGDVAMDDFSWRAIHEMTVAAKSILTRHYGSAAKYALFDGCSKGGGQAMGEAQRYPNDYNGIIAGSAGMSMNGLMASDLYASVLGDLGGGQRMTLAKLQLAQNAAVAACDDLDGLKDGVVADVRGCKWQPSELICKPGQDVATCLTPAEASAISRAEQPFRDPKTGAWLYGAFAPASETLWMSMLGNMSGPNPITDAYFRYFVEADPSWKAAGADPVALLYKSEDPKLAVSRSNATNTDLSAFRKHGGKLIQYHGWADQAMAPGYAPHYYIEVVDQQRGGGDRLAKTQAFYRLFMAPGMGHCGGGFGPVNFGGLAQQPSSPVDADHDVLEALDAWSGSPLA
jgi:feruloyl esterase